MGKHSNSKTFHKSSVQKHNGPNQHNFKKQQVPEAKQLHGGNKGVGLPRLQNIKAQMIAGIERKSKIPDYLRERLETLKEQTYQKNLSNIDTDQYAAAAQRLASQFEHTDKLAQGEKTKDDDPNKRQMIQTRRAFYKELKKVVDTADVVLQVLDARDPEGCRSHEIEEMVRTGGKKLVQVLNKIDLVPPQNARAWQRHLRGEFPVVLFKASQQHQNSNFSNGVTLHKKSLTQNVALVDKITHLTGSVGTENLMNVLKNYARTSTRRDEKQVITVGVVGFPNVGKSSIINSMKRSKACNTGNQPGVTRQMQEIQLDKHIVLLDSPGIILSTSDQTNALILRQAVKIEEINDPIRPVTALLERVEREDILALYQIEEYNSVDQMLGLVARKRGFLKHGGIANMDEAARAVLRDFLNGKISYFTAPPMSALLQNSDEEDEEMEEF